MLKYSSCASWDTVSTHLEPFPFTFSAQNISALPQNCTVIPGSKLRIGEKCFNRLELRISMFYFKIVGTCMNYTCVQVLNRSIHLQVKLHLKKGSVFNSGSDPFWPPFSICLFWLKFTYSQNLILVRIR